MAKVFRSWAIRTRLRRSYRSSANDATGHLPVAAPFPSAATSARARLVATVSEWSGPRPLLPRPRPPVRAEAELPAGGSLAGSHSQPWEIEHEVE